VKRWELFRCVYGYITPGWLANDPYPELKFLERKNAKR